MPKQIFQRQPQPKRMKMGHGQGIPDHNRIPNQALPKKAPKPNSGKDKKGKKA